MTKYLLWSLAGVSLAVGAASCANDDCETCVQSDASTCQETDGGDGPDAGDATTPDDQGAEPERFLYPLTLTAKKVATLPVVDGDATDEQWRAAAKMGAGTTQWQAVYTADELALLVSWPDRNLVVETNGSWSWDALSATWQTSLDTRAPGSKLHKESFYMAWDIAGSTVRSAGCAGFCHKDGDLQHHNTARAGEYVDTWLLLNKHGFGPASGGALFGTGPEDSGWLLGGDGATQTGDLLFDAEDASNPRSILAGQLTFRGHGEDKVMTSKDDDTFAATDTPAARYCARCHENKPGVAQQLAGYAMQGARTFGDTGELAYFRNGNLADDQPLYIEVAPTDFADALVLTQTEIDAGEAVAVAELSPDQLDASWAAYEALNAVLPELVLKAPTGSQADLRVAVTWKSGVFTLELARALVTGHADDVQFSDLSRLYYFAVTMVGGPSPLLKSGGTALAFER